MEDPYRCSRLRKLQNLSVRSTSIQAMPHECINFSGINLLSKAKEFYENESKKSDRHPSVDVATMLHWLLFLTIFMPLHFVVLILWTLPIIILKKFTRVSPLPQNLFPSYDWALKASLWIVFVPHAKIAAHGGFAEATYLWSLRPPYVHSRQDNNNHGAKLVKEREERREDLKEIQVFLMREELNAMRQLRQILLEGPSVNAEYFDLKRNKINHWRSTMSDLDFVKEQVYPFAWLLPRLLIT